MEGTVKSPFYEDINFPVMQVEIDNEKKYMIRHADLEQECIRLGFKVEFIDKFTKMSVNFADVMLLMSDEKTGRSAFGYGETNDRNLRSPISAAFPHKMAFIRAYDDAALAVFGLKSKVIAESGIYTPSDDDAEASRRNPLYSAEEQEIPHVEEQAQEVPAQQDAAPKQKGQRQTRQAYAARGKARGSDQEADPPAADGLNDDTVITFGPFRGKKWGEIRDTQEGERLLRFVADREDAPFPTPVFDQLLALAREKGICL